MAERSVIQEIKERLDIVEIVGRYVELQQVGGRWVAPCPFHNETKPSFSVGEEGFYYCFGCQATGDLITFYKEINGLDFKTALAELAREANVVLRPASPAKRQQEEIHLVCLDMHEAAGRFYGKNLKGVAAGKVRTYLRERGIPEELWESFGLGYCLPEWQSLCTHLETLGYTQEQGVTSGLLSRSDKSGRVFDRFRGRLMFPIQNLSGRVIAFGARTLQADDDPKYLNSSESPIYTKGEHLYGLYQARKHIARHRSVLLTEGYVDVLSLARFGFGHACGVLGTALTAAQVHRIAGLSRRVDLLFDGDNAGRKAALRSAEMILLHGLQCRVVSLPEGEDADSLLRQGGAGALQACLDQAENGLDFCLRQIQQAMAPADILKWALQFLEKLAQPELRAYYLPRLAGGLELNETELRLAHKKRLGDQPVVTKPRNKKGLFSRTEKEILAFAAACPEYRQKMCELGVVGVLDSQAARDFWGKLTGLSEQDLFSGLTNEERVFWIQSMQAFLPENKERQWQDIEHFIVQNFQIRRQEHLKNALHHAQMKGDQKEMARILQEYQRTLQE